MPAMDTTWRGHLTRDLQGVLEQEPFTPGDEPSRIAITARHTDDGAIQLQGESPCKHWTGYVSRDRQTWALGCQWGFTLRGNVAFAGGRFELTQTELEVPQALPILGEEKVQRVGVGA